MVRGEYYCPYEIQEIEFRDSKPRLYAHVHTIHIHVCTWKNLVQLDPVPMG